MNNFEIIEAKNGEKTCTINGTYLHSAYNPSNEAERFAKAQNPAFIPKVIFVFEPALSICAPYFKSIFPESKLCAIHCTSVFNATDSLWDKVFILSDNMETEIFNSFGEEALSFSYFCAWTPSSRLFSKELEQTVSIFKSLINKSHSILATRSFFEERWIKNALNITKHTKKFISPQRKTEKPVLIICSGPSLKPLLPSLKIIQDHFFTIVVSSALNPVLEIGFEPDLVLSTDGGYWAKKHLEPLENSDIPLALACEGNCPVKILSSSNIFLLGYNDGIETKITEKAGLKASVISRNGTVSGTALDLALKLSDNDIYFAGLDLSTQKGFQHTQNNRLELQNQLSESRKNTKETRSCKSEFSNQKESLKIYEDWFRNFDTNHRKIYRIIDKPNNKLGKIKDITSSDFLSIAKETPSLLEDSIFSQNIYSVDLKKAYDFLKITLNNLESLKDIYPMNYLQYTQAITPEKKDFYENILKEKADNLKKKLF